jgi:hypothetical protein
MLKVLDFNFLIGLVPVVATAIALDFFELIENNTLPDAFNFTMATGARGRQVFL